MHRKGKQKFVFIVVFLFCFSIYNFADALTIVQNQGVTVSAVVGSIPSIDPNTAGGGVFQSGVRFSGIAYPFATVTVQKKEGENISVSADKSGSFSIFVPEIDWQFFTLFAVDSFGRRSTILNFPTILYRGYITDIAGIRFAPTINTDKLAVKSGDFITIEGSAIPNKEVKIYFEGPESRVFSSFANNKGVYSITFPFVSPDGKYTLKAQYEGDTRASKAISISVGPSSITRNEATANIPGDCNFDQRITIVDFSILAYWYLKDNPPKCVDANRDGIINLVDFSIVAFYWNG